MVKNMRESVQKIGALILPFTASTSLTSFFFSFFKGATRDLESEATSSAQRLMLLLLWPSKKCTTIMPFNPPQQQSMIYEASCTHHVNFQKGNIPAIHKSKIVASCSCSAWSPMYILDSPPTTIKYNITQPDYLFAYISAVPVGTFSSLAFQLKDPSVLGKNKYTAYWNLLGCSLIFHALANTLSRIGNI